MLVGVLAISGAPLLSGWYSKDMILSASLGYAAVHREHVLLFALPALTAGMTAYYMFRLWFLAFTGPPRDRHVHEHAHESPWVMTLPLIFLAVCSVGVAWGWPVWKVDASYLAHLLKAAEPVPLRAFAAFAPERAAADEYHTIAGVVALGFAVAGAALAAAVFYFRRPATDALYDPGGPGVRFLRNKWYFDEAYDAAVLRPAVGLARATAAADKRPTDAPAPPGEPELPPKRFDVRTLDGLLNAVGQVVDAAGRSLRAVQTGRLRTYVLFLALTAVALLGILSFLTG
jgi:NADH-quinone oxidoreductase subunit L